MRTNIYAMFEMNKFTFVKNQQGLIIRLISNLQSSVGSSYSTIRCRGLCLNHLKKISQTWWSSVGSILQQTVVVCIETT